MTGALNKVDQSSPNSLYQLLIHHLLYLYLHVGGTARLHSHCFDCPPPCLALPHHSTVGTSLGKVEVGIDTRLDTEACCLPYIAKAQ